MDIVKTVTDWTRGEILSSAFFILASVIFLLASFGFWQYGKTDLAKAYIAPMAVAGCLLLVLGLGLVISGQSKLAAIPEAFGSGAADFVASELAHADKISNDYRLAVYRVIPLIIAACALVFINFQAPLLHASMVTTVAMMAVILLVDTNANARLEIYREKLVQAPDQIAAEHPSPQ